MAPIELEDILLFLLEKYKPDEIKECLDRVIQIHETTKPKEPEKKQFESDLRHKIMARKY